MFNKYFLECNINVTDKWQRYARKIVDTYKKDCEITESKPVPILKINDYPEILEPLENYKKYLSGHFRILIIKPGEHVHHHLDVNVQGQYSLIPKGKQITAVLNFPIYGTGDCDTIWEEPNCEINDPRIFYTNPEKAKSIKWKFLDKITVKELPVLLNTAVWHKVQPPQKERALISFVCNTEYDWKTLYNAFSN